MLMKLLKIQKQNEIIKSMNPLQLLNKELEDNVTALNNYLNESNSNIEMNKTEIKRTQKFFRELQNEVEQKAEKCDLEETNSRFKDYCAYKDLKALYKKVVPAVKGFEKNIFVVNKDMEQIKEIIRRFDEVILAKASKVSVEAIENKLADYTQMVEYLNFKEKQTLFENSTNITFKSINESLLEVSNKIDTEIKLAVKKATSYLLNEIKKSTDKGYVNKDTVLDMICDKVDKIELFTLLEHKSNKNDVETGLKAVDIMHKQIKNVTVILLELLTQFLEPDTTQNK